MRAFPHRLRLTWNGTLVMDAQCTSTMAAETTRGFFEGNFPRLMAGGWSDVTLDGLLEKLLRGERFAAEYQDDCGQGAVLIEPNEAFYNPPAPDPWHVGELAGDDGTVIRDENGLTVCTAPSPEAARILVEDHNRA